MYKNDYYKFISSLEFVEDLLDNILKKLLSIYFILDRVNEVAETERPLLLRSLSKLQKFQNLKLLISSRAKHNIALFLESNYKRL